RRFPPSPLGCRRKAAATSATLRRPIDAWTARFRTGIRPARSPGSPPAPAAAEFDPHLIRRPRTQTGRWYPGSHSILGLDDLESFVYPRLDAPRLLMQPAQLAEPLHPFGLAGTSFV